MCRATPDIEIRIAMDVEAVGAARRFVRGSACTVHGAEVLDTAVLLASELVANAVRHASPPVRLELRCDAATGMEIRVSDGNARAPVLQEPDLEALGGRGMLLVDGLSDAWGVAPAGAGKLVWCRLRAPA